MYRSFTTLGLLGLCLVLVGCQNSSLAQPTVPAVTIIPLPTRPFDGATYTYSPSQAATVTAFAPHYDLLHSGEQLRWLGMSTETVIEGVDASMLPSGQLLEMVGQENTITQTRWRFDLGIVGGGQVLCGGHVYVGDIIECMAYRVRVIRIFEDGRALAAWSLVDMPLEPLSQAQTVSAYSALLPPDEEGLVLPLETDVTFDESLSLFGSQPKSAEVGDGYLPEGVLRRLEFELAVSSPLSSFKRNVYAGDMLEFDDYRIRVLYTNQDFAYLAVAPLQTATATSLTPYFDLLHPGENVARMGINQHLITEEDIAKALYLFPQGQLLEGISQEGDVMQTRRQIDLFIGDVQAECSSKVYMGDIIECEDYRVRVISVFEDGTVVAAWSPVDTRLEPLSQTQIMSAYGALLSPGEVGLALPLETEVTYDDSLSLVGSQPKSEEVEDSYIAGGFHKRSVFDLTVSAPHSQFTRSVYAGDMLEFDDYRIRILYIGEDFAYLSISSPTVTD